MRKEHEDLITYILDWNEKINVTAIKDRDEFYHKNILDSIELTKLFEYQEAKEILDMGTGGGFPGLPLAIESPEKNFLLVDAVGKKLKVVEDTALKLGLKNVKTLHVRAEDFSKKEGFDLVVSRAVANLSTLSEYCLPFVKLGGYFIAYKTSDAKEEIESAANAIKILGGEITRIEKYDEEENGHIFVVIKKINKTPSKYPRKAGEPSKKPIA